MKRFRTLLQMSWPLLVGGIVLGCAREVHLVPTSALSMGVTGFTPESIEVGLTDIELKISGYGFQDGVNVFVGGKSAVISEVRVSQITARVPSLERGQFGITVVSLDGESIAAPGKFSVQGEDPEVAFLWPYQGPIEGGNVVTVFATNLEEPQFYFSGVPGITYYATDTIAYVIVPPGDTAGSAGITVENFDGGLGHWNIGGTEYYYEYQASSNASDMPSISSVSPQKGPANGNTLVTIQGTKFQDPYVELAEQVCEIQDWTSTVIHCLTAPASPGLTYVLVQNASGASDALPESYMFELPKVADLTPNSGTPSGGTVISISGSSLDIVTSVTIAGVVCPILDRTSKFIRCTAPAHSEGVFQVILRDIYDQVMTAGTFSYKKSGAAPLASLNGGFPIDAGELSWNASCSFHANGDISVNFSSATAVDGTIPAVYTMSRFSYSSKQWNYMTVNGWGTSGFPRDLLGGEYTVGNLGLDFDETSGNFYGVTNLTGRFAGWAYDDHGRFMGTRLQGNAREFDYYTPSGSFSKRQEGDSGLGTWNAWFYGDSESEKIFQFHPTLPMGLAVVKWVETSVTPMLHGLQALKMDRATHQWLFWNQTNLQWETSRPNPNEVSPQSLRLVEGGDTAHVARYPKIIPSAEGFWIVYLEQDNHLSPTQTTIRVLRYVENLSRFYRWTASGWSQTADPIDVNIAPVRLTARSDLEKLFDATALPNGDLQIYYVTQSGVQFQRIIMSASLGFVSDQIAPIPVEFGNSLPSFSVGTRSSGEPFIVAISDDQKYLLAFKESQGQWVGLGNSAFLQKINATSGRVSCVKEVSPGNLYIVYEDSYRTFASGPSNIASQVFAHTTTTIRGASQGGIPEDIWSLEVDSPSVNTEGTFDGLDVDSQGRIAGSYALITGVFIVPDFLNWSTLFGLKDWKRLRFTTSVLFTSDDDHIVTLSQQQRERSELRLWEVQDDALVTDVSTGNLSVFSGIKLNHATQVSRRRQADRLLVADSGNSRIVMADIGAQLTSAGTLINSSQGLNFPVGVCETANALFVLDMKFHSISRFNFDGSGPYITFGSAGGAEGELYYPSRIFCRENEVWVLDNFNNRVVVFDDAGAFQFQFSTVGTGLTRIKGIAFASDGALYLSGTQSNYGPMISKLRSTAP